MRASERASKPLSGLRFMSWYRPLPLVHRPCPCREAISGLRMTSASARTASVAQSLAPSDRQAVPRPSRSARRIYTAITASSSHLVPMQSSAESGCRSSCAHPCTSSSSPLQPSTAIPLAAAKKSFHRLSMPSAALNQINQSIKPADKSCTSLQQALLGATASRSWPFPMLPTAIGPARLA